MPSWREVALDSSSTCRAWEGSSQNWFKRSGVHRAHCTDEARTSSACEETVEACSIEDGKFQRFDAVGRARGEVLE